MVYTTDGRLEIDNNLPENLMRPIASGRKNDLFACSHDGARWAALLYFLLGSCQLSDVNPFLRLLRLPPLRRALAHQRSSCQPARRAAARSMAADSKATGLWGYSQRRYDRVRTFGLTGCLR